MSTDPVGDSNGDSEATAETQPPAGYCAPSDQRTSDAGESLQKPRDILCPGLMPASVIAGRYTCYCIAQAATSRHISDEVSC